MPRPRRHSADPRHAPCAPVSATAARRAIRPLLLLVALVNLAWSLYQLPVSRVVESRLCRAHYAVHDPSALRPDGSVPEERCKIEAVQQPLGRIAGIMETLWVAGDFFMTIPLVSLADHYGHRAVLCLGLVPRVFLLAWTFAVGYFDQVLPVHAIVVAPVFSFLGGDCVFNSIVYALVSELTDDHVLRATFFGYVNAVSSIFSLQLGPAIASATMSTLLWLPLWLGIALLVLAVPVISSLPLPSTHRRKPRALEDDESAAAVPLISSATAGDLKSRTAARLRSLVALLANPTRNFALLLAVFFLASLASSDTKLLPLYASTRYRWTFAQVGYLLSAKAVFNFVLLTVIVPRFLKWRWRRTGPSHTHSRSSQDLDGAEREGEREGDRVGEGEAHTNETAHATSPARGPRRAHHTTSDGQNVANAHTCLVLSILGALAIALAPTIIALVPALLLYALGIALPMFTYSLLRAPGMGLGLGMGQGGGDGPGPGPGTHVFSVVMLVRTVGTLLGAVVMPALWVAGLGVGGWAMGMPFVASAVCYAVAAGLVRRIDV